jgi:hypothetical protein
VDLTVVAVPGYFGSMAAERAWLRRRAAVRGPSPADYERRDTLTSLTMGTASLVAPVVLPILLRPVVTGRGRRALMAATVAGAVVAAVADRAARADTPTRRPTQTDDATTDDVGTSVAGYYGTTG